MGRQKYLFINPLSFSDILYGKSKKAPRGRIEEG